jgi:hypothetical protein
MYAEVKTENWVVIAAFIEAQKESADPVQITLNKSDGLFCATLVCKIEPADVTA